MLIKKGLLKPGKKRAKQTEIIRRFNISRLGMNKILFICLVIILLLVSFIVLLENDGPIIKLGASLPSSITNDTTILLSASFSDADGFVGNITLNELADGSTEKNLTFRSNGNQTVYLNIPKNSDVLNVIINIKPWPPH